MKVLHVGKFYPPAPGGIENFTRDLVTTLQGEGISVEVIVHNHRKGLTIKRDGPEGIVIHRVPLWGTFAYACLSPSFPMDLASVVRNFKPDLVHFHMPNLSVFSALGIPSLRRIPWIVHWHSDVIPSHFDSRLRFFHPLYAFFENLFLKQADRVIVTSPDYLDYSKTLRGYNDKCLVVPLGIDFRKLKYPESSAVTADTTGLWRNGGFKVFAAGRLTYYKGFDVLIRAFSLLSKGFELHIAGSGSRQGYLRKLVKELDLEDRVHLDGYVSFDKLRRLYATCDCFVLPSIERTEAFGLVLVEAMFYKKPVIVSDIEGSGVRWLVKNSKGGIFFKPGDYKMLAAKIEWMRSFPDAAAEMSIGGYRFVKERLDISNIARKIAKIYYAYPAG